MQEGLIAQLIILQMMSSGSGGRGHSVEARSLRSKCPQAMLPLKVLGKDGLQASILAVGGLPVILDVPWLIAAKLQSSHGILPVCMSMSKYLFL